MPKRRRPYTEKLHLVKAREYYGEVREYFGEEIARMMIEDFERLPEGPGKRRVREILSTFQRIGEIVQSASSLDKADWARRGGIKPDNHPLVKEASLLERKLWQAFKRYQMTPYVIILELWGGGNAPIWPLTPHLTFGVQLRSATKKKAKFSMRAEMEGKIVECLLECIKHGALHRILTCSCGKLFFQRFSHQHFCSEKCRSKSYQDSATWREYRRRKAREYYHLHKTGKVK